jgi:hypothetical protein
MATSKPSSSTEIEEIQRRMAQIRHDMHGEVSVAIKSARLLTDWRSLAGSYPWLTVGVAAAVGYWIVPKRRSDVPTIVAVNAKSPTMAALVEPQKLQEKKSGLLWSIVGTAFTMAAPIAVRAAQNYALQYVEGLLAQQKFPFDETAPDRAKAENGARPTSPQGPSRRFREAR